MDLGFQVTYISIFSYFIRGFWGLPCKFNVRFFHSSKCFGRHSGFLLLECTEQIEPDNPKEICCTLLRKKSEWGAVIRDGTKNGDLALVAHLLCPANFSATRGTIESNYPIQCRAGAVRSRFHSQTINYSTFIVSKSAVQLVPHHTSTQLFSPVFGIVPKDSSARRGASFLPPSRSYS